MSQATEIAFALRNL